MTFAVNRDRFAGLVALRNALADPSPPIETSTRVPAACACAVLREASAADAVRPCRTARSDGCSTGSPFPSRTSSRAICARFSSVAHRRVGATSRSARYPLPVSRTPPVIALLTDFGIQDHYVGTMKGVILGIAPDAVLVDIAHEVPPHDILRAAVQLAAACGYFPSGTIFLCVVDPGVGTPRRAIAVEAGEYRFVSPDNGLLTAVQAFARGAQVPTPQVDAVTALVIEKARKAGLYPAAVW